jgi:glycerol-3-phosphate O-acyltransferase
MRGGWLYDRFFEHIEVDESWAARARELDQRGRVVYVLRNLSFVDFFALDYLVKRLRLPDVGFANDLGMFVVEPGKGLLASLVPRPHTVDADRLEAALAGGRSAALFLKRPPTLTDPSARGKSEGDPYLMRLLDLQRRSSEPILLLPQVFLWSRSPDKTSRDWVDGVFGPAEWPGKLRTMAQFLLNYRHVTLRAGEALDLKAFLAQNEAAGVTDGVLVRRLVYALLRRIERERRSVLGPTQKPRDRVRGEVLRSPKLLKVVSDMAGEGSSERRVLLERAGEMLTELETALDMNFMNVMDAAFDATVARMYQGLEIDDEGLERLRACAKEGTLVLLPSHKSHVDYIILSKVFYRAQMPVPTIAAGDNLNFFPLGPFLRKAGAFFIRREFKGDRLYGAVVDAYIRRLILEGAPLEFYLEGGRSRTGKLLPPKLGLLSMVVDAAIGVKKPVYFCPISIAYERFVEEDAYAEELAGGEKSREDVRGLVAAFEKVLGRYGRISVQFGEPLTLEGVLAEIEPGAAIDRLTPPKRRRLVTRLAFQVMNEINQVSAVTPGSLVAAVLLSHDRRGLPHADMVSESRKLARLLHGQGARFSPALAGGRPGDIREDALRDAIDLFIAAGHVRAHRPGPGDKTHVRAGADVIYVVPDDARVKLDLSKNVVIHFFVERGLVATALATSSDRKLARAALAERVMWLSRLFKYEFQFRADAEFEGIFADTLAAMQAEGALALDGEDVVRPERGSDDEESLLRYARLLKSFCEAYRMSARGLGALVKGPLAPKDVTKRTLALGERMFLAGELGRREAICRPLVDNALSAFVDMGYLSRGDGKLALPESYASADAVRTIEKRVAAFVL